MCLTGLVARVDGGSSFEGPQPTIQEPHPFDVSEPEEVLSKADIESIVGRLAAGVLDACSESKPLAFVGIYKRGVTLMERVMEIAKAKRPDILSGTLDISLYRDDFDNLGSIPTLKGTDLPFPVDDCHVVLFDDVLFTGRTTRAAIDALIDYGRPACIQLAVLVDRGNRELPIAATYVGHQLETTLKDYVQVAMEGPDESEGVYLIRS